MKIKYLFFIILVFGILSCVPEPLSCKRGGKAIGVVKVDLDLRSSVLRTQEALIGNFITDAVDYFIKNNERIKSKLNTLSIDNVDFVVINGGAIRHCSSSLIIEKGSDFTTGMIDELLPFDPQLYLVELTGSEVKELFEHSVAKIEEQKGQFLQVSNQVKVVYDKTKKPETLIKKSEDEYEIDFGGERVKSITINNIKVDPVKNYYVALPAYLANGGDQYVVLSLLDDAKKIDLSITYQEILLEYFNVFVDVNPKIEGRIVYENE